MSEPKVGDVWRWMDLLVEVVSVDDDGLLRLKNCGTGMDVCGVEPDVLTRWGSRDGKVVQS